LSSKDSPAPPPAPDYAAAAQAQGQANLSAGLQGSVLSNPNIVSPYGNQTVTYDNGAGNPGGTPHATVNQSLTPDAQAALTAQQKTQAALANLGQQGAQQAGSVLGTPFQYNGPGINTSGPQAGPLNYGPDASKYSAATGLDLSGVAKAPINAGTTAQQAILSRLNPQIDRSNAALQSRLANQGITQGSEAYNNAQTDQGQQNNDLQTQAALQGINLDMAANQQGYGQALSSAGFYNSGQAQNYGNAANSAGLYNSAQGQNFNQGLQSAQFSNTAAQQSLQQQLALRNQPLNEITALESGSQIQNPQFQQYQGQNVAAAPVFQGAQAQGQYGLDQYGIQQNAQNSQLQGLYGLGGTVGAAALKYGGGAALFSDVRLKSNIVRIDTHRKGFGIYEYDIAGRRECGVIAQEVQKIMPEAVSNDSFGWLMVDYALIAGGA
jgi:hypothetical protein